MASYLFFFGRSQELSLAELRIFFPSPTKISDSIYAVEGETLFVNQKEIPVPDTIHILGGTIKIAKIVETVKEFDSLTLARVLLGQTPDKMTFGCSTYEGVLKISSGVHQEIKELLEGEGKKVRFVLPSQGSALSGVAVAKQGVQELNIVPFGNGYLLAITTGVQEFEEWAVRDFDRPYFDSKKGMLPPKAARMAVNIGLGADAEGKTVLDPFCGMGTIPGEALLRGAVAMGSDNDEDAIEKAKKNSIWLRSSNSALPPITYFVSDATHVSENIREGTIDAIVTEPFMGSPNLGLGKITDKKEIRNAVKGLEKLYIGCLREWHDLLKPNGVIVMALPEIELGKTKYFVKNVIDSCETLGYTTLDGPLPYSRPQAIVRRMFYLFKKINSKKG